MARVGLGASGEMKVEAGVRSGVGMEVEMSVGVGVSVRVGVDVGNGVGRGAHAASVSSRRAISGERARIIYLARAASASPSKSRRISE